MYKVYVQHREDATDRTLVGERSESRLDRFVDMMWDRINSEDYEIIVEDEDGNYVDR